MMLNFKKVSNAMDVASIPYEYIWTHPTTITCSKCKTRLFICRGNVHCNCGRVFTEGNSIIIFNELEFDNVEV
jgi:hypothetical protein